MFKPVILSLGTGYKVRNAEGEDLGRVEDVVLERSDGCIHYGILSAGGFLHVGNHLVAVPWNRLEMQQDEKTFQVNIDKETLRNAGYFTGESWPDMTLPEWCERVETYFAYNPADESQAAEGNEFIENDANSISVEEMNLDEQLSRRVEFELFATKAFNMDALNVTVRNAEATLDGRVESRAESILAVNTARAVEGINSVVNKLKVSKIA